MSILHEYCFTNNHGYLKNKYKTYIKELNINVIL